MSGIKCLYNLQWFLPIKFFQPIFTKSLWVPLGSSDFPLLPPGSVIRFNEIRERNGVREVSKSAREKQKEEERKRVTIIYLLHSPSTAEVKIAGAETKNKKHLAITSCKCLGEL